MNHSASHLSIGKLPIVAPWDSRALAAACPADRVWSSRLLCSWLLDRVAPGAVWGRYVTLAALIILDEDRPNTPVLGLSWPEFQLRRALRAGALHLVLVSDRVTRDVVEAVDRLRGEGLSTTLARSNAQVADLFHPDEAVLFLTGNQIVGDGLLVGLLQASGPALLCIEPARAGPGHELIDARSHWLGIGRVDGAHVRAIAPLSGDWDLGSTLMRNAVAARAKRTMLTADDMLLSAAAPAATARAIVTAVHERPRGWGARWVTAPLSLMIARSFPAILPFLARTGPWLSLIAFALSSLVQLRQWTTAALILYLAALLLSALTRIAAAATGIPVRYAQIMAHARDTTGVVLLVLIVVRMLPDLAPVVLGFNIVGLLALAERIAFDEGASTAWHADIGGCALVLLIASFFGQTGFVAGLGAMAVQAFITVAFLQNRLSRALTSPR